MQPVQRQPHHTPTPHQPTVVTPRGGAGSPRTPPRRNTPRQASASLSVDAPEGLDVRGRRLWGQLRDSCRDDPAAVVLLEEACRIADRLDGLDRILRGENRHLLTVAVDDVGEYRFYVDAALSEARQQVSVLRQLIKSLPARGESENGDPDGWLGTLAAVPS